MFNCIVSLVSSEIPPCVKLYADLPGPHASESPPVTLPTDLPTLTARPDIVLVSEESVTMLELTIPSNSKEAIIKAKEKKTNNLTTIQGLISYSIATSPNYLEGRWGGFNFASIRQLNNI